MLRKLAVLAICALAVLAFPASAAKPDANVPVTIMTQNMDDGTDLTFIIGWFAGQFPGSLGDAVDLTFAELQASNFEGRAKVMAARIAAKKPDILALQEAVLWRFGPDPDTALLPLFDQLDLLQAALVKVGAPYDLVAVQSLNDLAQQGGLIGGALRFTDRNAVLVRSDLKRPKFYLDNFQTHTFVAYFPFAPGLDVIAGWIDGNVHVGDKVFRFATTHLETPIAGVPYATQVQVWQAQELIEAMLGGTVPVVICGDFNSDANHGGFVDDTPTVGLIEAAGYTEVWPATHGRGDFGLTWPFYLEDQYPPPFFAASKPFERIDLFFSRDIRVVNSERVIAPVQGHSMPPYASDHAGVIATFRFDK
ncbi:MAG: endonuclease/exonuclease/phosphatase family protein [Acidobacteriota bacterium]